MGCLCCDVERKATKEQEKHNRKVKESMPCLKHRLNKMERDIQKTNNLESDIMVVNDTIHGRLGIIGITDKIKDIKSRLDKLEKYDPANPIGFTVLIVWLGLLTLKVSL